MFTNLLISWQNGEVWTSYPNPKLLESLALIEGAVIINKNGFLESYGAMIKSTRTLKNFGTRHSAAISSSKKIILLY